MKNIKKLLSVFLAAVMLLGSLALSSSAVDWPKEAGAGRPELRALWTLKSVEIPVSAEFTEVSDNAEFTVYYTTQNLGQNYGVLNLMLNAEAIGSVHAESAYIAENVLHINLSSLNLSREGFYHIYIGAGSLKGTECQNTFASTSGMEYKYESLGIKDKLSLIADYAISFVTNYFSYKQTY